MTISATALDTSFWVLVHHLLLKSSLVGRSHELVVPEDLIEFCHSVRVYKTEF